MQPFNMRPFNQVMFHPGAPNNILPGQHNILSAPHNILSAPHNILSAPHNILSAPHNIPPAPSIPNIQPSPSTPSVPLGTPPPIHPNIAGRPNMILPQPYSNIIVPRVDIGGVVPVVNSINFAASRSLMIGAANLSAPKPKLQLSVYVGKIPDEFSDEFIQSILSQCGKVLKWNRTKNPTGDKLCNFGFCEFHEIKSVYRATRIINGLTFADSKNNQVSLLVKCEEKVVQATEDWRKENIESIMIANDISLESATLELDAEGEELKEKVKQRIDQFFEDYKNGKVNEDERKEKKPMSVNTKEEKKEEETEKRKGIIKRKDEKKNDKEKEKKK